MKFKRTVFTQKQIGFMKEVVPTNSFDDAYEQFKKRFPWKTVGKRTFRRFCDENNIKGPKSNPTQPIGKIRITAENREQIKTASGKWEKRANVVWRHAHGNLPEKHFVIHADMDKANFDVDNLLLVNNAEFMSMRRLGLHTADPDLSKLGLMIAKVKIAMGIA